MFNKANIYFFFSKVTFVLQLVKRHFQKTERLLQALQDSSEITRKAQMSEESPKDTQLAFTKCTICMLVDMQAILPASMNWGVNPDSKLKENQ